MARPSSSRRACLQWLSLVGMIWLQAINGTNNNFPAYSSQLKHALSISQLQLNNLAFASDAGKLFAFASGLAAARLPLSLVLAVGSVLGLAGYGLQYFLLGTRHLLYWQAFVLSVVAGNSICWLNTVSYVVSIRNFAPRHRQLAVGLTSSYQGLSAKIYTDAVAALGLGPAGRAKTYLLLNSIGPLMVSFVTAPFVGGVEVLASEARRMDVGFAAMLGITAATGIYSVTSSLGLFADNVVGTLVFLAVPLAIPAAEKLREALEFGGEKRVCNFPAEEGVAKPTKDDDDDDDDVDIVREEIGVGTMVTRLDFWLYFFVYLSSATLGLVFINNLGQIAESRGCSNTSSLVSLSSSFGFFGRLMPSLLDYYFSRSKYMVSRVALIAGLATPIAGSFFLLINPTDLSLYVSTAVIGVCAGAITSVSVLTTSELFGTRNFSVNHNVVVVNIPVGSFLFGYLAAVLYRREGSAGKCMGAQCYDTTFLIWGFVALVGTILAVILYVRTRKFYSQR